MAKMIIHDLTKELNTNGVKTDNKAIISFLESKGITGKTHSSAIEDSEISMVKSHFAKPAEEKKTVKTEKTDKPENTAKAPAKAVEKVVEVVKKKKSNIIFAINRGDSRNGMGNGKQ